MKEKPGKNFYKPENYPEI